MNNIDYTFLTLPEWYQKIFGRLLSLEFDRKELIKELLSKANYTVLDETGTLTITVNEKDVKVAFGETVPVEGFALDSDGTPISVLLFCRTAVPYMFEILRADGRDIIKIPEPEEFEIYTPKTNRKIL